MTHSCGTWLLYMCRDSYIWDVTRERSTAMLLIHLHLVCLCCVSIFIWDVYVVCLYSYETWLASDWHGCWSIYTQCVYVVCLSISHEMSMLCVYIHMRRDSRAINNHAVDPSTVSVSMLCVYLFRMRCLCCVSIFIWDVTRERLTADGSIYTYIYIHI